MAYIPIQHHELLRDLWGHRGITYKSKICQSYYTHTFAMRSISYLTPGTHPKRLSSIDAVFTPSILNTGRIFSWENNNHVNCELGDSFRNNGSSNSIFLSKDVINCALQNVMLRGIFNINQIYASIDPVRMTRMDHFGRWNNQKIKLSDIIKTGPLGAVSFEQMCLEKAHIQVDMAEYINKYKNKYKHCKYNKISTCIKDLYGSLRLVSRMLGMDKVNVSAYHLLDLHTERLALLTGYTNQLRSIVNTLLSSANGDTDDSADYNFTPYDTSLIVPAHTTFTYNNELYNKPFNFHRSVTTDFKLLLNSVITTDTPKGPELITRYYIPPTITNNNSATDTVMVKSLLSPPHPVSKERDKLHRDPSVFDPPEVRRLIGEPISVTSDIDNTTELTLPGIPSLGSIIFNLDYAPTGILAAIAALKSDLELSDLDFFKELTYTTSRPISESFSWPLLYGLMVLSMLRIHNSETSLAYWLLSRDTSIPRTFPYVLKPSSLPHNININSADKDLELQGALLGVSVSSNYNKTINAPSTALLLSTLLVRLLRRLLAFMLRTLRKNATAYANEHMLRINSWALLRDIAYTVIFHYFGTDPGKGANYQTIFYPLHARYTLHSMLPTTIDDLIVRVNILHSHLDYMLSLNAIQSSLDGNYTVIEHAVGIDKSTTLKFTDIKEVSQWRNNESLMARYFANREDLNKGGR